MVTIHREAGLQFVVYKDDHLPAHVHIYGGDGIAKIELAGRDGAPELISSRGISAGDLRRAVRIVKREQLAMLAHWSRIHG